MELETYANELHARALKHFPTRKVKVQGKNDVWGMDLNDMTFWADENDGYKFILVVEDIYTRKAWAMILKDKTGAGVLESIKLLIKTVKAKPNNFWTDKGKEFYNNEMTKYLKTIGVRQYSVYGESKVANVERLNQTLKNIMFKLLTKTQTHRWIDVLQKVMDTYNSKRHSVIKMSPNEAWKHPNEIIDDEAYDGDVEEEDEKPRFKLGDYVRVSRVKGTFEKGFDMSFTPEVFQISGINHTHPVTYQLTDMKREPLEGTFYEQEMKLTKLKNYALVESVLERKKGKVKVKYMGWPDEFNEWLDKKQVTNI